MLVSMSIPQAGDAAQPPVTPTPYVGPRTSSAAITALILAISSWLVCPLVPAVIALFFASNADREIAAGNGWITGEGMVTAAKVTAWINVGLYGAILALSIVAVAVFAVIAALGVAFG